MSMDNYFKLLNQERANDCIHFCSECFAFQKYLLHHWPPVLFMLFEENDLSAPKARYAPRSQSFDKQFSYNGTMCA